MSTRLLFAACLCSAASLAHAQGGGPPPAAVEVGAVTEGRISPSAEFRATVFYKEVANVATEVEGKIIEVAFEEGDHITAGEPLIRLDAELLQADLANARANYQRARTLQKQEQVRLERAETLLDDDITTEQEFDDIRFTVERYGHEADAAQAMVRRLESEIAKKTVRAPFDGVVLERRAEVGDWMASGDVLAVYARGDVFDIIANVPESRLPHIAAGQLVPVHALDREFEGAVQTKIPRGDIETRTFPVKIRVQDQPWLLEGMSATVRLPIGQAMQATLVPRDAIVMKPGTNQVFLASDDTAREVEVEVLGYEDGRAGVRGDGIEAGMQVVVKGQERLRDGQPLQVQSS